MKIGITGGVGSGKSTVSRILESMGYRVFYSDLEAKKIIQTDSEVREEIVHLLGENAFVDGVYNVPFVANQVFTNPSLKDGLNAIVHPRVRQAFHQLEANSGKVFNEAAILFETGLYQQMDYTILVVSPLEMRLQRTMKRDSIGKEEVELRMNNQWSDEKKEKLASFVVYNDEVQALIPQVNRLLTQLI